MPQQHIDDSKLRAARQYFQRHFQALTIYDTYIPSRKAQIFRAYHVEPQLSYTAVLSHEFFENHTPQEIERLLEHWQVAEAMRAAEGQEVMISRQGLQSPDL